MIACGDADSAGQIACGLSILTILGALSNLACSLVLTELTTAIETLEGLLIKTKRDQSDRGSLPYPRRQQSPAQTFAVNPHIRRLQRWLEAESLNQR